MRALLSRNMAVEDRCSNLYNKQKADKEGRFMRQLCRNRMMRERTEVLLLKVLLLADWLRFAAVFILKKNKFFDYVRAFFRSFACVA